jgi:hypothetical protein
LHEYSVSTEFGLIENNSKAEIFGYINNQHFRVAGNGRYVYKIINNHDSKIFFDNLELNNIKIFSGKTQKLKILELYAKKAFCNHKNCVCKESRWSLKGLQAPYAIEVGEAASGIFEINHIKKQLQLHSCKELDLRPLLNSGENMIKLSQGFTKLNNLRIGYGTEVDTWEIRDKQNHQWRSLRAASNLQIQNIASKNFVGEFEYRATLYEPSPGSGETTLFFQGIDGIIDVFVDDKLIFQRGAYHWEDRVELPLPPNLKFPCELKINLANQIGLCGISNHVYIGRNVMLSGKNSVKLPNDYDFAALRCGELRIRALVCDDEGKIIEQFLANGMPHLVEYDKAVELRINCFEELPQTFYPRVIEFHKFV